MHARTTKIFFSTALLATSALATSLLMATPAHAQSEPADPSLLGMDTPHVSVDLSVLEDSGYTPNSVLPPGKRLMPGPKSPVSRLLVPPASQQAMPAPSGGDMMMSAPVIIESVSGAPRMPDPANIPSSMLETQMAAPGPVTKMPPAAPAAEPAPAPAPVAKVAPPAPPPPAPKPVAPEPTPEPAPEPAPMIAKAPEAAKPEAAPKPAAKPAPEPKMAEAPAPPPVPVPPVTEAKTTPPPAQLKAKPAAAPEPAPEPAPAPVKVAEPPAPPPPAPEPPAAEAVAEAPVAPPPAPVQSQPPAQTTPSAIAEIPPAGETTAVPAPQQEASLTTGEPLAPGHVLGVIFTPDASKLPDSARNELKSIAARLQQQDSLRLQLLAYAGGGDMSSSAARRLSLSRALEVRSFLIENGIRSTRIDVRALGNKTTEAEPNRVDINVIER